MISSSIFVNRVLKGQFQTIILTIFIFWQCITPCNSIEENKIDWKHWYLISFGENLRFWNQSHRRDEGQMAPANLRFQRSELVTPGCTCAPNPLCNFKC